MFTLSEYPQGWFLTIRDVAFKPFSSLCGTSHLTLVFCLNIHIQTSLSGLDFQKKRL